EIHDFIADWERDYSTSTLQVFAAELGVMPCESALQVGMALDNLLSWSSWNQMRVRRSLTIEQTSEVLALAIHALLG
ncbi:MAG TPA: hypothetical protein VGM78_13340, partial [Ilumatobacteraceae bacterium]